MHAGQRSPHFTVIEIFRTACLMVGMCLVPFATTDAEDVSLPGVVLDTTGHPVPNADVGFHWDFFGERLVPWNWAFSDASGKFVAQGDVSESECVVLAFNANRNSGCIKWLESNNLPESAELILQPMSRVRFRMTCSALDTVISSGLIEFEAVNPKAPAFPETQDLKSLGEWYRKIPEGLIAMSSFGTPSYSGCEVEVSLPPGRYFLRFNSVYMSDLYLPLTVPDTAQDMGVIDVDLQPEPLARLVGKAAPDWHITDCKGLDPDAQPDNLRGKWLLLQFWSHDDDRSIEQTLPKLIAFHEQNRELQDNLQIVAIHGSDVGSMTQLDQQLRKIDKLNWNLQELPFPVIVDATSRAAENYSVTELPQAMLINPDGLVCPLYGLGELKSLVTGRMKRDISPIEDVHSALGATASPTAGLTPCPRVAPIRRLTDHKANVHKLVVHQQSNSVFTVGMDMLLNQYDLTNGRLRNQLRLDEKIEFSSEAPPLLLHGQRNIVVTSRRLGGTEDFFGPFRVETLDAATLTPVVSAFPEFTGQCRFAVANDQLLVVRWDSKRKYSTFTVLDFASGEVVRTWKSPLHVDVMKVAPDDTTVVCAGSASGLPTGAVAFSFTTGKRKWVAPFEGALGAADICISPDGESFIASNWLDQIHLRSMNTGTPQRTMAIHNHNAMSAAFSRDGKLLATAGANSSPIVLWNVETGEQIALLIGHRHGRVHRMQFAGDSTLISCGGKIDEGEVCFWNLQQLRSEF